MNKLVVKYVSGIDLRRRVEQAPQEIKQLRSALEVLIHDARDVADESFLNWRLILTMRCDEAQTKLDEIYGRAADAGDGK